jgi:hypothetical protein
MKSQADSSSTMLWGRDDSLGSGTRVWFRATCEDGLYRIAATNDRRIARRWWPRVLAACRRWNSSHAWPQVHLYEPPGAGTAEVFAWAETRFDLPARAELHRVVLEDFTDAAIASMLDCFERLEREIDWPALTAEAAA